MLRTMKITQINLDIWKCYGYVIVGGTAARSIIWAKKRLNLNIELDDSDCEGYAFIEKGVPWVIWVSTLSNAETISHEALHITRTVLESRGLVYSGDSEEAWTYTMGFIVHSAQTTKKWKVIKTS